MKKGVKEKYFGGQIRLSCIGCVRQLYRTNWYNCWNINRKENRYEKQGKTSSTRKAGTSFKAQQKKWQRFYSESSRNLG